MASASSSSLSGSVLPPLSPKPVATSARPALGLQYSTAFIPFLFELEDTKDEVSLPCRGDLGIRFSIVDAERPKLLTYPSISPPPPPKQNDPPVRSTQNYRAPLYLIRNNPKQ